jgi:hypothetical protein
MTTQKPFLLCRFYYYSKIQKIILIVKQGRYEISSYEISHNLQPSGQPKLTTQTIMLYGNPHDSPDGNPDCNPDDNLCDENPDEARDDNQNDNPVETKLTT